MVYRDTHINVSINALTRAHNAMVFSANELSRSNVVKLRREAAALRRLSAEVKKTIKNIYQRRPE